MSSRGSVFTHGERYTKGEGHGLFGKLKQALSSGGVKVKPHLPNTLKSGAEELIFSADFTPGFTVSSRGSVFTRGERYTKGEGHGLFGKLKQALSSGGVKVKPHLPNTLKSGAEELIFSADFTNTTDEERTVTLAAGETRNIDVVMPLTLSGEVLASGSEVPEWMQKAEGVLSKVQGATSKSNEHVLDITVHVDGFNGARTTTHRIGKSLRFG